MSDPTLRLLEPKPVERSTQPPIPVGIQLVNTGLITQATLLSALDLQNHVDAPLGEILVAQGHVERADVLEALAIQHEADRIDLAYDPPARVMAKALPVYVCQRFSVVPWRWIGSTVLVATSRPDQIKALRAALPDSAPTILPVIADANMINAQIGRLYGRQLTHRAINKVPEYLSCRSWSPILGKRLSSLVALIPALLVAFIYAPAWLGTTALLIALITMVMTTSLKAAALFSQISHRVPTQAKPLMCVPKAKLPRVSVLVPLFREERIAEALINRLSRLTYPKALLEIVLVLEERDNITRTTLGKTDLPQWISVIEVPDDNTITTKPRALNYALDFCTGSIIGVWDAEDAPEPDQIEKIVSHFHSAGPKVACLQGILDYYNSAQNWIARCFTIEYATWWRLFLPGIERLNMVLPLGGTTLFFRRHILEELGGWDAHNVTEDADLGVRLARKGYKTELVSTVTYEEANCKAWPWVKQRSRWLKGFLITYFVHMRRPRRLLSDLGLRRFFGFQVMFLATVLQFASLPLLWTLWMPMIGLPHPMTAIFGDMVVVPVTVLVIVTEVIGIVLGLLALSKNGRRNLMPWVLAMPFYFILGALASYKALYELALNPFYWDKTQHGLQPTSLPCAPLHPASDAS